MKIVVLGGDGFIGSHLVEIAHEQGHDITVFDRFPNMKSNNLEHLKGKVRFLAGEFANQDTLEQALEGQDVAYHFVWGTDPNTSWNDPLVEVDLNLRNSILLMNLAVKHVVKKLVFISSGGTVYGPQEKPISEQAKPRPLSPYGITKLAVEYFLEYFRSHSNLAFEVYRVANAYGPRQAVKPSQGVIGLWMWQILNGEELKVYGGENSLRDYVYVKDVAFLMIHALSSLNASGVYNLGTARGTSPLGILDIFKQIIDVPFRYKLLDRRSADYSRILLDNNKILSQVKGFRFGTLEENLPETWIYFKQKFNKSH